MGVKLSEQLARYQTTVWRIALLLAVYFGFEAGVNGQPAVIQEITIIGTERPVQLETKAGDLLQSSRVARDVKRLWATGWFDDIRVENESVPQGAFVRFRLTERPRYLLRRIDFKPREFELPAAQVPSGTLVNRVGLERLAKTFGERLKDSGYRDAIVQFDLIPVGLRQADVLFRVKAGRRYVVDSVEISGMSHQDSRQVAKLLDGVQPRTLVPGIPGVWKGWKLRRPLNQEDLNLALQRLRSHFISQGYLDATTHVEATAFEENLASISIRVLPGIAYRVESLQAFDTLTPAWPDTVSNQLPLKELCDCLREKRAQAERRGVFDFAAQLLVRPTYQTGELGTQPGVSLSARIKTGPPYRVGRIEFRGNHEFGDLTLRKVLLLSEGEWFDRGLLRRSLTRLNLTGLVHPVTEFDVEIQLDSAQHLVDLVIPIRERNRGRWFLSAPAWGGRSRAGFSINLRLPNWGPSYLELPTHFVAFSVASPLLGLPRSVFNQPHRSISLARPYFPGQSWRSGFHVSPQFTWPQMLLAPGMQQLEARLAEWLQPTPALTIPVQWDVPSPGQSQVFTSGDLVCDSPRRPQAHLLNTLLIATEWLVPAGF